MSDQEKEKKLKRLAEQIKVSRQDTSNPFLPIDNIPVLTLEDEEEDENTLAKSIVDEIIEETEGEGTTPPHYRPA
jgi:hypothetical protein